MKRARRFIGGLQVECVPLADVRGEIDFSEISQGSNRSRYGNPFERQNATPAKSPKSGAAGGARVD